MSHRCHSPICHRHSKCSVRNYSVHHWLNLAASLEMATAATTATTSISTEVQEMLLTCLTRAQQRVHTSRTQCLHQSMRQLSRVPMLGNEERQKVQQRIVLPQLSLLSVCAASLLSLSPSRRMEKTRDDYFTNVTKGTV